MKSSRCRGRDLPTEASQCRRNARLFHLLPKNANLKKVGGAKVVDTRPQSVGGSTDWMPSPGLRNEGRINFRNIFCWCAAFAPARPQSRRQGRAVPKEPCFSFCLPRPRKTCDEMDWFACVHFGLGFAGIRLEEITNSKDHFGHRKHCDQSDKFACVQFGLGFAGINLRG